MNKEMKMALKCIEGAIDNKLAGRNKSSLSCIYQATMQLALHSKKSGNKEQEEAFRSRAEAIRTLSQSMPSREKEKAEKEVNWFIRKYLNGDVKKREIFLNKLSPYNIEEILRHGLDSNIGLNWNDSQ